MVNKTSDRELIELKETLYRFLPIQLYGTIDDHLYLDREDENILALPNLSSATFYIVLLPLLFF